MATVADTTPTRCHSNSSADRRCAMHMGNSTIVVAAHVLQGARCAATFPPMLPHEQFQPCRFDCRAGSIGMSGISMDNNSSPSSVWRCGIFLDGLFDFGMSLGESTRVVQEPRLTRSYAQIWHDPCEQPPTNQTNWQHKKNGQTTNKETQQQTHNTTNKKQSVNQPNKPTGHTNKHRTNKSKTTDGRTNERNDKQTKHVFGLPR